MIPSEYLTRLLFVVKELASNDDATSNAQDEQEDEDEDVPDVIDTYISNLIQALQHKVRAHFVSKQLCRGLTLPNFRSLQDTVVRYSAAKGLARLCERLPKSFISQVSDAVVSLFHINIPDLYEGANDLSSVSEYTWQGACMALAEQARRGLLFADELGEKLEWIEKVCLTPKEFQRETVTQSWPGTPLRRTTRRTLGGSISA